MALTGLFLCVFLVVHLMGNLQLFKHDDGFAFNHYSQFMTGNPLIKIVSYITYFAILYHAFKGLIMTMNNRKARPVKYQVDGGWANSHWTSRNMGILGTVLLVFIVIHMIDFWYEFKFGNLPTKKYIQYDIGGELKNMEFSGEKFQARVKASLGQINDFTTLEYKDLYKEVYATFDKWWYVLLYTISMFAVAFHLWHGFKSAFQSLGISHPAWNKTIKLVGYGFAVIVPLGFALIPLIIFFS